MKLEKIFAIFASTALLLSNTAIIANATDGTSSSYKLDISDITSSNSNAASIHYNLSTGVLGDSFDGKATSTNYRLCAGQVEELYGNCGTTTPPTPPNPPNPPSGGGNGGGSGYVIPKENPPTQPHTQETTQQTKPENPTSDLPENPDIFNQHPENQTDTSHPSAPENTANHTASPNQTKPHTTNDSNEDNPDNSENTSFIDGVWCSENACYSTPATIYRPAALENPQNTITTTTRTSIIAWLLIILTAITLLTSILVRTAYTSLYTTPYVKKLSKITKIGNLLIKKNKKGNKTRKL